MYYLCSVIKKQISLIKNLSWYRLNVSKIMTKLLDFFTESANTIEKTANAENGTIYNKKAFDAFIIDSYPESVADGEIMPSKYENCAKKARKKLRNFLLQTLEAFLSVSDKKQKEKFAKEFANFYTEFYKVNDYSVASVTNGKMKAESIATITKALKELKALQTATEKKK